MRHYTEQIIKFAEDKANWPTLAFKQAFRPTADCCGDISRFIYSNQSVMLWLSKDIIKQHQDYVQIIPEMDSDITENQKYYAEGVAFCEFDCFQEKLFITEEVQSMLLEHEAIQVPCMIYASELARENAKHFLHALTDNDIDFHPIIPKFVTSISSKMQVSEFEHPKYYPDQKLENHSCNMYDRNKVDVTYQKASMLFINIPFEIYSECLNNMHHMNYNLNHHEFMCLRKSKEDFKALCDDIEQNGLQTPITFSIIGNNIAPIENSSRILMAILLKIPSIIACVACPLVQYNYGNMYFSSKNTKSKLTEFFNPYFLFL